MEKIDDEDEQLRSVALQNAQSILAARQRAEEDLVQAKDALRESTNRLQLALSAGELGDWSWDARTDIVNLGKRAADIFGLPHDASVTWDRMRELLHEDDREPTRLAVVKSLEERTDYSTEYRVNRPAGDQCWVSAKGRGFYAEDGSVLGMIGVVQDVSERKRAEEALHEETRNLELLNKTGTTLASSLDLQTLVQAATDAATELSGAKFGSFFYNVTDDNGDAFMLYTLSGAPREAFEKFGQPRTTALFGLTFRGEGSIRSDDILKDPRYGKMAPHHGMPPGHLPVRSYLAVPVISRSGEVIGGLFFGHPEPGVFSDRDARLVTGVAAQAAVAIDNARLYETAQKSADERNQLLENERLARSDAEHANAMKDEFLATLSHELRTPLNAILGWSQILRRRTASVDADLSQGLEIIERNARAQTQLIEDLLDMSRITSGKVRLDIQPVAPVLFIESAIEAVRPAAEAKGIRLEKLLDATSVPISGDPGRLQQIIWNLLSNAIKFTPKGGKVQVLLERVNSHIEISVADTGIGIKPEFLPYVFERFRQADASTTRGHGGLGLGLSIVKHLVELHGGTVHAKSPGENQGATFTINLPLTVVHRHEASERFHPTTPKAMPLDFKPSDLSGIKVLVVDDEVDTCDLIERVLSDAGADVTTACGAHEALTLIQKETPHVLISDIGMPGIDGFELLRRVRALGQTKGEKIPAIALTAFARSEDRTRALRAGFQVHVSKPVEPSELLATVVSVAGRTGLSDVD